MSFINKDTQSIIQLKLTEKGREQLAKGDLNFSFWALGDSEVCYCDNGALLNEDTPIFKPLDRNPSFNSFLLRPDGSSLQPIDDNFFESKTVKILINNKAITRGFYFSDATGNIRRNVDKKYYKNSGFISINDTRFTVENDVFLQDINDISIGDYIIINYKKQIITNLPLANIEDHNIMFDGAPNITYQIQGIDGNRVILDRPIPLYTPESNTYFTYFIINKDFNYYDEESTSSYWDEDSLTLEIGCNKSIKDVPVWNQNITYCENIIGTHEVSGGVVTAEQAYGSATYGSRKFNCNAKYLGYKCTTDDMDMPCDPCGEEPFDCLLDEANTQVGIFHYSNNTISNFYGEYLFINQSKKFSLTLPQIMWYNKPDFGVGMKFISDDIELLVDDTGVKYFNIIEDKALYSDTNFTPKIVGRVFPDLKVFTIHDYELLSSMSYVSNRNWTLPSLCVDAIKSKNDTGILDTDKVMYVTYFLTNDTISGDTKQTASIPTQYYSKVFNNTGKKANVQFRINKAGLLKYMVDHTEINTFELGFFAQKFYVLYQIANKNERPKSEAWNIVDFSSNVTTNNYIDPIKLEDQDTSITGFLITGNTVSENFNLKTYRKGIAPITGLNNGSVTDINKLNFGDEIILDGNVGTFIGATTFKTFFNAYLSPGYFTNTTNDCFEQDKFNLRFTEMGIYDDKLNLVVVTKFSEVVEILPSNNITIEATLDF